MRRVHFFEFEDLPWFPQVIRESMTDFLSFMGESARAPYREFVTRLHGALARTSAPCILELCAGGGGPALAISALLREQHGAAVPLLLTDRYPNLVRFERAREVSGGAVDFVRDPVDATQVPASLTGFRLVCNAFHHFREDAARSILLDAVDKRQGIAVFEGISRSPTGFMQLLLGLGMIPLVTPFIRPFRLSRLVLTYLVPAMPLFTAWDGTVSCLRIYSPQELRALVDSLPPNDYVWDIGQARVPLTPMTITYLIGSPP